jgi:hypothetical protein
MPQKGCPTAHQPETNKRPFPFVLAHTLVGMADTTVRALAEPNRADAVPMLSPDFA